MKKNLNSNPKPLHLPPIAIAIDFDGTCVRHEYPEIGSDIGAIPVLRELSEAGHKLILFTMRSGRHLSEAQEWFMFNGIPLEGVQYNPTQAQWTSSNKCYAHLYIDDAALGCPLVTPADDSRPYVDWAAVRAVLISKGIL